MTKSVYRYVRSALEDYLANTSNLPTIHYENTRYKPTTGTEFISTSLIPAVREPAVRGTNPQHYYNGTFQCLVHYPYQNGPGATENTVDTIIDRFNSTTDITYSSSVDQILLESGDVMLLESGDMFLLEDTIIIRIRQARRMGSYTDEPWYKTPVHIDWYLYK